ncbi:DUF4184 family protein [Kitasatospora sp. DSM 101779]|uniref:DUF4184 family protein n=1 Tax=Kitasatospora sp. DSM 101779 TaxID=2853165 RepID=UPI0021D9A9FB|nr:DUF4184 family protein [Kitasatospora sp. DSM 101779]MCU7825712.1 DUF4184 family protein [Kitasatospora sp. DSM 101779]
MPFTLSHVAAVVPLIGRGDGGVWVASGLVAGSMAPDVPFFADSLLPGVYRYGAITHRWWAVPTVDAGLAAGMVAAWHGLLREPLTGLWPVPAEGPLPRGAAGAGAFVLSAAVGAASHVLWDSFTHPGRAGVRAFPVLGRPVAAGLPLCTVLQYGTSLLGLAVLRARVRREPPVREPGRAAVGLVAAAAVGAVHRLARRQRSVVPEFCFGAGAGLAVGATAYAVLSAVRARVPSGGTAPGTGWRCVRPSAAGRRRAGRAPR